MANEAGDMKLLDNYAKLIDLVAAEPNYPPPNPKITVTAMRAHHTESLAAALDVPIKHGANKVAITERQLAYDDLPEKVTRPGKVLTGQGVATEVIADLKTSKNKVLGRRKSPKVKDDPNTPAGQGTVTHSASQTSFANQRGNYRTFLAVLAAIPEYQPNDPSLKLPALNAFADELEAKDNAVNATFVPLNQSRGVRDGKLYLDDDCVVNRALMVKAYVAGEFGTSSTLYKAISGLKFPRSRKR